MIKFHNIEVLENLLFFGVGKVYTFFGVEIIKGRAVRRLSFAY